jgi:hypothetical protein
LLSPRRSAIGWRPISSPGRDRFRPLIFRFLVRVLI